MSANPSREAEDQNAHATHGELQELVHCIDTLTQVPENARIPKLMEKSTDSLVHRSPTNYLKVQGNYGDLPPAERTNRHLKLSKQSQVNKEEEPTLTLHKKAHEYS